MTTNNEKQSQAQLDLLTAKAILDHMEKNKPTITYGQLADSIEELRDQPMANQGTRHSLGRIQKYCEESGVPILSSMVVSKAHKEPSDGFFVAFNEVRPGTGLTEEEIIHKEQGDCINHADWQPLLDRIQKEIDSL